MQESDELLKTLQNQQALFVGQYQELTKVQALAASNSGNGKDPAGTAGGPAASAASAAGEQRKRLEQLRSRRQQLELTLSEGGGATNAPP